MLVLEILAARLMAPYLGVSLDTYTGIIGTVLAGIAAGAWIGGRSADRFAPQLHPRADPRPRRPARAHLADARQRPRPERRRRRHQGHRRALAWTVFLPALVLSAVTPVVVKLQLRDLGTTGTIVGRLSAFATAGRARRHVRHRLLPRVARADALIVAGTGRAVDGRRRARRLAADAPHLRDFACSLLAVVAAVAGGAALGVTGPCESESAYFCIRVVEEPGGSVRIARARRPHAFLASTSTTLGTSGFPYIALMAATVDAVAPARRRDLDAADRRRRLLAAAVRRRDPRRRPPSTSWSSTRRSSTPHVASSGCARARGSRVDVGDARLLVREKHATQTYDFIFGDAFGSRSVPWHLTTREFLTSLRRLLRPGGAYVMNLIDHRRAALPQGAGGDDAAGLPERDAAAGAQQLRARGNGSARSMRAASGRSSSSAACRSRR